jgi:repressor LexA
MQPRTKRQRQILTYIIDFIENHGYEPSYQQIANSLGLKSKGGIAKHIAALEKKGLISRNHTNGSFNLDLLPQHHASDMVCEIEWLPLPGKQVKSVENEYLYVPKQLLGLLLPTRVRALLVPDNAMLDEQICEDDIALIETKTFARDGETVAARIADRKIVLRKFYRMGANIRLAAANERFEPLIHPADWVKIVGIYRGLLRPIS